MNMEINWLNYEDAMFDWIDFVKDFVNIVCSVRMLRFCYNVPYMCFNTVTFNAFSRMRQKSVAFAWVINNRIFKTEVVPINQLNVYIISKMSNHS